MSFGDDARPGTAGQLTRRDGPSIVQSDETARLRAELEQARVVIEDMEQRLTQLTEENIELRAQSAEQVRLRTVAEREAERLREEISKPRDTEESPLRHELSVTLEELQVMQEELQVAHEALARARVVAN
jgi:ABC-type phosphate transport system auxiliary subunit